VSALLRSTSGEHCHLGQPNPGWDTGLLVQFAPLLRGKLERPLQAVLMSITNQHGVRSRGSKEQTNQYCSAVDRVVHGQACDGGQDPAYICALPVQPLLTPL
jgi:hypothetical protein